MAIDNSKGVQWVCEQPDTPITIFKAGTTPMDPPIQVFKGVYGQAMVDALSSIGVVYNYDPNNELPIDDTGLLYSTNSEQVILLILASAVDITENDMVIDGNYTPLSISMREPLPSFISNTYQIKTAHLEEGDKLVIEPTPLSSGLGDGFDCMLSNAQVEPVGQDIILISGSNSADLGALVGLPETVTTTLRGPEGGATITDNNELSICLKPVEGNGDSVGPNTTPCFELSGLFAIEINGEIVPYHFSETDLPLFFNASNPYGIQFAKCQDEIVCTPQDLRVSNNNILDRKFTAGDWSMDYQLNGGETRTYTVTLAGDDYQLGVYRNMIQEIFSQEDFNIQWVDGGGGGIGHFQTYNWSINAGRGDASGPSEGGVDNSRSVKFIKNDSHANDLFWFFFDIFDDLQNGAFEEAISCGLSEFPGF